MGMPRHSVPSVPFNPAAVATLVQLTRASAKAVKNSFISKHFQNNTAKCPKLTGLKTLRGLLNPALWVPARPFGTASDLKPKIEDLSTRSTASPVRDVQSSANKQKFYSGILSRIVPVRHQTKYGDSFNRAEFISHNREASFILEFNNIRLGGWLKSRHAKEFICSTTRTHNIYT